jgi:hypothetical protein
MNKPRRRVSDEEFERQYAALQQAQPQAELRATEAFYDWAEKALVVQLENGSTITTPVSALPEFKDSDPQDIAAVQLRPTTTALHWEKLDQDFTVGGLIASVFGRRAFMAELGRRGGSATSAKKAVAARRNGMRGGRPRKPSSSRRPIISKNFKVLPLQPEPEPLETGLTGTSHMPTKDLITYESGLCAVAWNLPRRFERTQSKLTRNTLSDVVQASLRPSQQDDMFWMEVKDNAGLAIAA